jgi:hypothetical protein
MKSSDKSISDLSGENKAPSITDEQWLEIGRRNFQEAFDRGEPHEMQNVMEIYFRPGDDDWYECERLLKQWCEDNSQFGVGA